ncbi:MAG: dTMP kinase [Polyangiales bacterium]|jgi:dTMP kinase
MIEGLFIALEGVDGAGTTTHTRILRERMRGRGLPTHSTREPSDGPIGTMIRQILSGRLVVPGVSGPRPPSWTTMALLFAADRTDHVEAEIVPNLMDGVTVLSDRYVHSSVAYQSLSSGGGEDAIRWVREINAEARRPDLTLVLDVSAETARERRDDRGGRAELYEYDELQVSLAAFYANIEQYFPGENIVHVDANGTIEDVAKAVYQAVCVLRGE